MPENLQVVVDHGKELETEGEFRARLVQLSEGFASAGGRAFAGLEQVGRHGDGAVDEAGEHDAGRRVEMHHFGRDAGTRRLLGRYRLVGAVDIFLGALAGDAQAIFACLEDEVGETAEPLDGDCRHIDPRKAGDAFQGVACLPDPVVVHPFTP